MTVDAPRFPLVLGHAEPQALLLRALARGQLHHAIVLVGPRGVGKATLARGLGCALHCREQPGVGCGACPICRRVRDGNHVGVEWIVPEGPGGKIKVEQARTLRNRLQHAPFEGDAHLVVFDPADAMGEATYNALLKSLEEPAPGVHFVMLTTNLASLLPTILSRCMTIRMGRLDDDTVAAIVEAQEGSAEIPTERLSLAVRLADGSAGAAVELALDASLDASLEVLREAMAAARAGPDRIFAGKHGALWDCWDRATAGPSTGKPARERAAAGRVADLWMLHLRERMRGREGLPDLPESPAPFEDLRVLEDFRRSLDRNPNVRLALEQALLELSA